MPATGKLYKIHRFVCFHLEKIIRHCTVTIEWEPTTKKGKRTQSVENMFAIAVDTIQTGCFEEFRTEFQKSYKFYSQRLVNDVYVMRNKFFAQEGYDLVLLADKLFEGMELVDYGPYYLDTIMQDLLLHLDNLQRCKTIEEFNGSTC